MKLRETVVGVIVALLTFVMILNGFWEGFWGLFIGLMLGAAYNAPEFEL